MGFRVLFWVKDIGFRIEGLGFRVESAHRNIHRRERIDPRRRWSHLTAGRMRGGTLTGTWSVGQALGRSEVVG